jgi:hypothetical protein
LRPTFWIDRIGCSHASGWIFSDSQRVKRVFVRREGLTIAETSSFYSRPDVAAAHPNSKGAEQSGFSLLFDPPAAGQTSTVRIFSEQEGSETLLGERLTESPLDADILKSRKTRIFQFEFTSRCNLRCVYCAVSQPDYVGRDMPTEDFDRLLESLKERHVEHVHLNGLGETTIVPDWQNKVCKVASHGLSMSIISNFARLMSEDELEAMAHVAHIEISIDSHRADLLQKLRRRVDVRNILTNMVRVHAAASRLGIPKPSFSWACVVSDKNAFDVVDYAHFALVCGVKQVTLCNLVEYEPVAGALKVNHVTTMPPGELARFARMIEAAKAIMSEAGGQLSVMAGLADAIADTLAQRQVSTAIVSFPLGGSPMQRKRYFSPLTADESTRDCLDPWFFAMLMSNRGLQPCCYHPPIGTVGVGQSLEVTLEGDAMRELRRQLLTGELSEHCRSCPARGMTTPDKLRTRLIRELDLTPPA